MMAHGYKSSFEMAKVLVQYIPDPARVRREIAAEFDYVPELDTIVKLRARVLERRRSGQGEEPFTAETDAIKRREAMEMASDSLLRRIYRFHPYVFDAAERQGRLAVRP